MFSAGARIKVETVALPTVQKVDLFSNKWDFYDLFHKTDFSNVKYKLINNANSTTGTLDQHGRTERVDMQSNEKYDILIGTDDAWTVSIDDESDNVEVEYNCSSCHQNNEEEH